jgi:hypothetical protein
MSHIIPFISKEILKPEYAYIIYLPIPEDEDKLSEYNIKNGIQG